MKTAPEGASDCNQPLTTFVQTDADTFRQVVQRLTGSGTPPPVQTDQQQVTTTTTITTTTTTTTTTASITGTSIGLRKTKSCKLHERRQYMRPKLEIVKPMISTCHFKPPPATSESCSPLRSPLLSPSTIFSKLSIHQQVEQENKGETLTSSSHYHYYELNTQEEKKAIKERRFYLHPSPRGSKSPELLTLFPLTSPKSNNKPS